MATRTVWPLVCRPAGEWSGTGTARQPPHAINAPPGTPEPASSRWHVEESVRSVFARALLVALVLVAMPPSSQVELVSIPEVVTDEVAVSIPTDAVRLAS